MPTEFQTEFRPPRAAAPTKLFPSGAEKRTSQSPHAASHVEMIAQKQIQPRTIRARRSNPRSPELFPDRQIAQQACNGGPDRSQAVWNVQPNLVSEAHHTSVPKRYSPCQLPIAPASFSCFSIPAPTPSFLSPLSLIPKFPHPSALLSLRPSAPLSLK